MPKFTQVVVVELGFEPKYRETRMQIQGGPTQAGTQPGELRFAAVAEMTTLAQEIDQNLVQDKFSIPVPALWPRSFDLEEYSRSLAALGLSFPNCEPLFV